MLILIPTLCLSVSNPKSFFGQISAKKFKVVHFDSELAHMVYRGCWFLFRHWFLFCSSELPTLIPFLGKFGLKNFVFPKNWHTNSTHTHTHTHARTHSISKMLILISILVFSNFKPKSWGCWFFEICYLKFLTKIQFFGQIWVEKLEFSTQPGSLYTEYLKDLIVTIQSKVSKKR